MKEEKDALKLIVEGQSLMKSFKIISVIIIFLSFVLSSSIVFIFSSQKIEKDSQKQLIIAEHVYDCIYSKIMNPIMVAKTMAYDTLLQEKLHLENTCSESEMEEIMTAYLENLRTKLNYSTAFVVSESTKRYYTAKGITKILNAHKIPYDIWYQLFTDTDKEYDLDTDRDQANEYNWTVFINIKIFDSDGEMLGVCGVGVIMDELQELFSELESEFDIKVNMIDTDGLVQIDTNSTNIENAYISAAIEDKAGSESFTYKQRGLNGIRMVRFMKDLDWYVVVQGTLDHIVFGRNLVIILTLSFLFVLCVFFILSQIYSKKDTVTTTDDTLEDHVTGLPNRNYFKEAYGEMGIFTTTRYKSMAFFDIDNFENIKTSNNGNKILKDMIDIAKKLIFDKGQLLRWENDSFMALLEVNADETKKCFSEICERIKNQLDVTISVGIIEINLSDTIKLNYYRAVQACYSVKESGGNGVRYHAAR